jgi:hypothetical protein
MADTQHPYDDETFRNLSTAAESQDAAVLPTGDAAQRNEHLLPATGLRRNGHHQSSGPLKPLQVNKASTDREVQQSKHHKLLPYILGAVGVIVILTCLSLGAVASFNLLSFQSSLNSPQTTVSDFYSALHTGDFQSAYNQLSSNYQRTLSYAAFQAKYSTLDALNGPIQSYQIGNVPTKGDNASATVKVVRQMQTGKAVQQTQTVQLIVENSAWKIDQINAGQTTPG